MLRTSSASIISEKVVLPLNNYSIENANSKKSYECDIYHCHPDHIYVVFGNYFYSLSSIKIHLKFTLIH